MKIKALVKAMTSVEDLYSISRICEDTLSRLVPKNKRKKLLRKLREAGMRISESPEGWVVQNNAMLLQHTFSEELISEWEKN